MKIGILLASLLVVTAATASADDLKSMSQSELNARLGDDLGYTVGNCGAGLVTTAGATFLALFPMGPFTEALTVSLVPNGMGGSVGDTVKSRMQNLNSTPDKVFTTGEKTAIFTGLAIGIPAAVVVDGGVSMIGHTKFQMATATAVALPVGLGASFLLSKESGCRQALDDIDAISNEKFSRLSPSEQQRLQAAQNFVASKGELAIAKAELLAQRAMAIGNNLKMQVENAW